MKLFLKRSGLFLLTVAVLLSALEFSLRMIPNHYSYKSNFLSNNASEIEILVLGHCHGLYGINPDYLTQKGFNAAHAAQSLKYDYFIFNKYKDELKNLKVLILPITYPSLFYQLEDSPESERIKYYSIYYDSDYHKDIKYNFELYKKRPFTIIETFYNYFRGKSNMTISDSGFGLVTKATTECCPRTGPVLAERHTNLDLKTLEENTEILNNLATECERRGIKVILLTTPALKYYRDKLDKKQLSLMTKTINETLKLHPNVEYYNFIDDPRFKCDNPLFGSEDFKNADILNAHGAEKFTKIIDNLINKPNSVDDNKESKEWRP
jgi:hypothetical protein